MCGAGSLSRWVLVAGIWASASVFVHAAIPQDAEERAASDEQNSEFAGASRGYPLLTLLNDALIQKELRLYDTQRVRLEHFAADYLRDLKSKLSELADLGDDPAGRAARLAEISHESHALQDEYGARCAKVLSLKQRKRLDQITFQLRGFEAFYQSDIAEELRFTGEQRGKLAELRTSVIAEAQALLEARAAKRLSDASFAAQAEELLASAKLRAVALLAAKQARVFDASHGEPISFKPSQLKLTLKQQPRTRKRATSGAR